MMLFMGGKYVERKYGINLSHLFLSLDVDEKYYDSEIIINCKDFMITKFERR